MYELLRGSLNAVKERLCSSSHSDWSARVRVFGRARSTESPCPGCCCWFCTGEREGGPRSPEAHRQRESNRGLTDLGKHGGVKAQDLAEGHKVSVRRLGRVSAAASSHAKMLMLAVRVLWGNMFFHPVASPQTLTWINLQPNCYYT